MKAAIKKALIEAYCCEMVPCWVVAFVFRVLHLRDV